MKKLMATLTYLRAEHIFKAILAVHMQNVTAVIVSGFAADDPVWWSTDELRKDLWTRTRAEWCRFARKDFTWFPYNEDIVARLYSRCCLASVGVRQRWREELQEGDDDAT